MSGLANDQGGQPATCGLCGALVFAKYTRCEFCGTIVQRVPDQEVKALPTVPSDRLSVEARLLLLAPLVCSVVLWFYIAPKHPMQQPYLKLSIVVAITVIATAQLALIDAQKTASLKGPTAAKVPVPAWFVLLLLIWPFAYPAYFRARSRIEVEQGNKTWMAIVVVVVMLTSIAGSIAVIQHRYPPPKQPPAGTSNMTIPAHGHY